MSAGPRQQAGIAVILTHAYADFDAVASMLAAARLYPGTFPVLPRVVNRDVREFLALYREELPFLNEEDLPEGPIERVILVDTQQVPRLARLRDRQDFALEVFDHHPAGSVLPEGTRHVREKVGAATTTMVRRLIARDVPLGPIDATLLLLGIYQDTGCLTYPDTTALDAHCVAWLLERGASVRVAGEFLNRPLFAEEREFYERLAREAETLLCHQWRIVLAQARAPGYTEELAPLAHRLLEVFDPDALFLLVQLNHHIQIVARSKSDAIDVGRVLGELGGGGHRRAAAAVVRDGGLAETRQRLVDLLERDVRPAPTAGEVMTRGVPALSPETTLSQAAVRAARHGLAALPVVDGSGALVGIINRADIDRAVLHGLGARGISHYLTRTPDPVTSSTPVEEVRRAMVERDAGGVAVVDEGKLSGIVTRRDLLKLWPSAAFQSLDLGAALDQGLPETARRFLHRAGELATAERVGLYLVGGLVRDLLLGVPNLDLDLVVEGDAVEFAERLARDLGGRAKTHRRFGTAKLILHGPEWAIERAYEHPDMIEGSALASGRVPGVATRPLVADFASARMEFYEHPAALPSVEASSIGRDLFRRDFSINAMAICLDAARYGRLLDPYGGLADLRARLLRVLHNLSFVEDPTRILRAVRLEQRLGFLLEARTAELIADAIALGLMDRVSGQRIRNEILLSFLERDPAAIMRRLDELGVLSRIHPGWRWDVWLNEKFAAARALPTEERSAAYFGLLAYHLGSEPAAGLARRLALDSRITGLMRELGEGREIAARLLDPALRPSEIARQLERLQPAALQVLALAVDEQMVAGKIERYLREWRLLRPTLGGAYLLGLGVSPGPVYRRILGALHEARLDGRVITVADEEAFVQEQLRAAADLNE